MDLQPVVGRNISGEGSQPLPLVRIIMKSDEKLLTLIISLALVLGACASQRPDIMPAMAVSASMASEPPAVYVIQPGDQLDLKFFYNPELNENVTVRPDGMISLQLVDEIRASGLTPVQLDDLLTQKYSHELKKPMITVIVRSFTMQRVYVGGEVNRQGFVNLTAGMTPLQAVLDAGGLKETADPEAAIVIRKGPDRQPVPVRADLKTAVYGGGGEGPSLQAQDVVYVPKSAIAEANKFVKQYIEDLLLFRGVSLGFSYELHSDSPNINR
jgi:polysaccharide biosynthesis/export protein